MFGICVGTVRALREESEFGFGSIRGGGNRMLCADESLSGEDRLVVSGALGEARHSVRRVSMISASLGMATAPLLSTH